MNCPIHATTKMTSELAHSGHGSVWSAQIVTNNATYDKEMPTASPADNAA